MRTLFALVATAVLLLPASPAAAVELRTEPPYVPDTTRVERIAAGLREDPLFVDPSAAGLLEPEHTEAVRDALADQPVPVHVVIAPSTMTDESGGDGKILLHALHHVLGEDGVYVLVNSRWLGSPHTFFDHIVVNTPIDPRSLRTPEPDVDNLPEEPTTAREREEAWRLGREKNVDALVELLESVPDAAPAEPASPVPHIPEQSRTAPSESSGPSMPSLIRDEFSFGLLLLGPVLGLVLWGKRRKADRRRRTILAAQHRTLPKPLRARRAPTRPGRARLRRMLRGELARLTAELEAAGAGHPGRSRAARAFDAAGLLEAGPESTDHDLVGAIVVAREGRAALAADGLSRSLGACAVNPLHGAPLPSDVLPEHVPPKTRGRRCARCVARGGLSRPLRLGGEPHDAHTNLWTGLGYGRAVADLAETVLKEIDAH